MGKAKAFLMIQSVILVLAVVMLSAAAIGVYRNGKARKAEDPTAFIYTKEEALDAAAPGAALLLFGQAGA